MNVARIESADENTLRSNRVARMARRLLPQSLKVAGKRMLLGLIDPRTELPRFVAKDTGIVKLTTQTSEGTMVFDARDAGVGWRIAIEGGWEPDESRCFRSIVKRGDLAVDAGANIGWYTLLLSGLVGESGCVVAFEPDPRNFELLCETIQLNGRGSRVTAYQLALLSDERTIEFERSRENFGDHRVRFQPPKSSGPDQYSETTRQVISVKGRTLDRVLEEHTVLGEGRPIKLVKVDCQGSEPSVIGGAQQTLGRTAYLAIEYWPYAIRRSGFDPFALIRTLAVAFDSFAVIEKDRPPGSFEPTSGLAGHAATVGKSVDYLFRKSQVAGRM
jgi:FkbM family methyltransferase